MSYILDALKKADQERTLGEVPDLEAAHWGERRRRKSTLWVWVVALLLLVNGGLLLVMMDADNSDGDARVVQEPAAKKPVVVARPPPEPQARPEIDVVPFTRKIEQPRESVYIPPPRTVVSKPPPVNRPRVVTAPAPVSIAGDTDSVSTADPSVPGWHDLSLEFRERFIVPVLDVHVYAEAPGRRFILVDLQKYREGDTLENGAVLEVILPDGIQLNFQGTRFRLDK